MLQAGAGPVVCATGRWCACTCCNTLPFRRRRRRRDAGTDELEMQALALLMAHSVKEQRSTYDRRTKAQKVTPAVELLAAEAGRLLA